MHPVAHKLGIERAFALRDFVFVMRKLQIGAPAVNVDGVSEERRGHGRAFNMPARTALAVRRWPPCLSRLVGFGRFPEHEIKGILLGAVNRHPLARAQVIERLARQAAIRGEAAHGEIDVTICRPIGKPLVFKQLDKVEHLRHVVGGTRLVVRPLHAQRVGVLVHGGNEAASERTNGFVVFHRPADDLVIDVGDVADIGDRVTARSEPALHSIKHHHDAGMPDMAKIVNRHAADVHANPAGF